MKRIIPALAIMAIALTGCASWTGQGVVTEKTYREAYTTTSMMLVGKVMVPQTRHHTECYELTIRANDDHKERGLCFDQSIWGKYELGSRITVKKD